RAGGNGSCGGQSDGAALAGALDEPRDGGVAGRPLQREQTGGTARSRPVGAQLPISPRLVVESRPHSPLLQSRRGGRRRQSAAAQPPGKRRPPKGAARSSWALRRRASRRRRRT